MAKHAIWEPLNDEDVQPFGSPHVLFALVHVPHEVPGPSCPHAAVVFGIPVFGSSRTAPPMSAVSEMMPIRTRGTSRPDGVDRFPERPPDVDHQQNEHEEGRRKQAELDERLALFHWTRCTEPMVCFRGPDQRCS